jgi:hypothetical protein
MSRTLVASAALLVAATTTRACPNCAESLNTPTTAPAATHDASAVAHDVNSSIYTMLLGLAAGVGVTGLVIGKGILDARRDGR